MGQKTPQTGWTSELVLTILLKKNERASFRHVLEGHASPFSTPFQDVTFIISHDTPWYKQVNFEYIGGSRGGAQGGGRFPVNGTLICTKN